MIARALIGEDTSARHLPKAQNYHCRKWQPWGLNQEYLAPKLMLFLLLTLLAPNSLLEQVFTMGSRALPRRYAACGRVCAFLERAES